MGNEQIFLCVDLARLNCFSSICGMGGLLSGLLHHVSEQKMNSKAEP